MPKKCHNQGFMLIEMVLGIIVIAILFVSLIGVMRTVFFNTAEPLHQIQAMHFAEYILDEALSHSTNEDVCNAVDKRVDIQSLCQYGQLRYAKKQIVDLQGKKIEALKNYQLAIDLEKIDVNGVNGIKVEVRVVEPLMSTVVLSGVKI